MLESCSGVNSIEGFLGKQAFLSESLIFHSDRVGSLRVRAIMTNSVAMYTGFSLPDFKTL